MKTLRALPVLYATVCLSFPVMSLAAEDAMGELVSYDALPLSEAADYASSANYWIKDSYIITFKEPLITFLPSLEAADLAVCAELVENSKCVSIKQQLAKNLGIHGELISIYETINAIHVHMNAEEADKWTQDGRVLDVEHDAMLSVVTTDSTVNQDPSSEPDAMGESSTLPESVPALEETCITDPASCNLTQEQVDGILACKADFDSETCIAYRQTFESMPIMETCKENAAIERLSRFNTQDGILSVPQLQIDNGPMFYNAQLKLNFANGTFRLLSINEQPETVQIQLGCPFTLGFKQYGTLPSTNLGIHWLSVSDSRCPITAICVWAGEALVTLEAVSEGQTNGGEFSLTLGDDPEQAVRDLGDYRLTLLEVSPYPSGPVPATEQNHEITLRLDAVAEEQPQSVSENFEMVVNGMSHQEVLNLLGTADNTETLETNEMPYCSEPLLEPGILYEQWEYGVDHSSQAPSGFVVWFAQTDESSAWKVVGKVNGFSCM